MLQQKNYLLKKFPVGLIHRSRRRMSCSQTSLTYAMQRSRIFSFPWKRYVNLFQNKKLRDLRWVDLDINTRVKISLDGCPKCYLLSHIAQNSPLPLHTKKNRGHFGQFGGGVVRWIWAIILTHFISNFSRANSRCQNCATCISKSILSSLLSLREASLEGSWCNCVHRRGVPDGLH